MCRPLNVATPPAAVAEAVPRREPVPVVPLPRITGMTADASVPVLTRLSNWSRTWITGCGAKFTPATTDDSGWVTIAR